MPRLPLANDIRVAGGGTQAAALQRFPREFQYAAEVGNQPFIEWNCVCTYPELPPRGPGPAAPSPGRQSTAKDLACAVGVPRMVGALVQR